MKISNIEIKWLGHSGFLIKNSKIIYIDPYNIKEEEKADFILITHSHYDHCSVADIEKIIKPGTKILITADSQSKVNRFKIPLDIIVVEPNQEYNFNEIKISTIPAYNTDKPFHPKEEGWIGYLVKINGALIYHAGDTDKIPEMQKLTGYQNNFVAILPIGGRFTMTPEEAADASSLIKPNIAIPMHYGSVVGSSEDAKHFAKLCEENGIKAEILEKS